MKTIIALIAFASLTGAAHAEQSLSEILLSGQCTPHRMKGQKQIEGYNCLNLKSDSLQMNGIQKAAITFADQDEFAEFENQATDLSHVNDSEKEVELQVE